MDLSMTTYKCARCSFETKYKHVLQDHLQRKSECPTILSNESREKLLEILKCPIECKDVTYDCSFCDKQFNSSGNRSRHQKICKKRDSELDIKEEVANLKKELEQLKRYVIISQNSQNITNNTNTQNITINVRDFGKENISYLDFDFLTSCVEDMDLVKLIKDIHCNKEHPENHTIRVKNLKERFMEKRENGNWMVEDTEKALSELVKLGYKVLNTHYTENKDEFSPVDFEEINEWFIKLRHNESKTSFPIKKKLLLLFVNNKTLLLGKDT